MIFHFYGTNTIYYVVQIIQYPIYRNNNLSRRTIIPPLLTGWRKQNLQSVKIL